MITSTTILENLFLLVYTYTHVKLLENKLYFATQLKGRATDEYVEGHKFKSLQDSEVLFLILSYSRQADQQSI